MSRLIDHSEITRQLLDLPGWAFANDAIHATVKLPTFVDAIKVVTETADDAEEMNHHPDIDIRYNKLTILISTHDAGGVTQLDIELAHRITKHVHGLNGEVLTD